MHPEVKRGGNPSRGAPFSLAFRVLIEGTAKGPEMLILLIILILLFGGGGGYYGHRRWGPGGGAGIGLGTILVIILLFYLLAGPIHY